MSAYYPPFLQAPDWIIPTNLRNPLPNVQLTIIRGEQKGEVIFLRSKISLFGRMAGIRLRDALASRKHMQIYFDGHDYILEDLASSNGTYVNGNRISQPVILRNGDVIQVGFTHFRFEFVSHNLIEKKQEGKPQETR